MASLEVLNPATNEVIETLEYTSETTAKQQIEKAHKAFKSWREVDAHERADKLYKWFSLINEHKDELAELITKEGGKPLKEHKVKWIMRIHMFLGMPKKLNVFTDVQFQLIHLIKILL